MPVNLLDSFDMAPIGVPSGTISGKIALGIPKICPFKCLSLLYHSLFLKSNG